MEKLVKGLVNLHVKKIAIFYANTEFGKGVRDSVVPLLTAKGVNIVSEISVEVGQMDFTGELTRAKASGADTFFFGLQEEECGRILPQIKAMGLDKLVKIVGSINLLAADTIRLAKEAADGAQGQVDFSPSGEKVKSLEAKYEKKYKEMGTHNFYKGYLGTYVVKAVVDENKSFDQQKFRDYLHNRTLCVKDHPGILMDVRYHENGDIDRESFLVKVENQKHVIGSVIPPSRPEFFGICKK